MLVSKAALKSKFFLFASLGQSVSIAACSSRDLLGQLHPNLLEGIREHRLGRDPAHLESVESRKTCRSSSISSCALQTTEHLAALSVS